ncbi:BTAD domain-containing putative transcriptional regulator [Nocardia cyriacigeorgica]|uniref:BTAD domain-containing putative transcriptional regulator n=1 Tax=Nocardia cyriacigeorgica TaxID=135487 RepID=UPI00245894D4|nr:BTAD domain-containing putative transcriptional regulator [Nocardia cyriacigeorgica]
MRPQAPYLIAVAGLSSRAGTTTTTVALAHTWPGPETALVVEADPAGGQLADMVGADPYLGSASLARRTALGVPMTGELLGQHVQYLPGGQAFLAAPPGHAPDDPVPAAALLTDLDRGWRGFGAVVFAYCGVPEPGAPAHPVIAAADSALFVVRAEHIDPETAAQRVLDLTRRRRPRGLVVIGGSRAYIDAIGFPVVGELPVSRSGARALLTGRRSRQHLIPPARGTITAVEIQLRRYERTGQFDPPHIGQSARHQGRSVRRPRRGEDAPRIYAIDPATVPTPRLRPREPVVVDTTETPASEPVLAVAAEDAGQPAEGDLAAVPEPSPHPEIESTEPAPGPTPADGAPALAVRVFGPTRIFWNAETGESVEITTQLQPRARELVAVLALHPEGLPRQQLIERLWGDRPGTRGSSALANTLSRLRAALGTATGGQVSEVLAEDRTKVRLSSQVGVDYWDFNVAVAQRRHARSDTEQAEAARRIAALATSELASDLTDTWVQSLRESARRTSLNALSWLATRSSTDLDATLGMLETAVENDPYNEAVWHDLLRLHARRGETAALTRTYRLLTRRLSEIGQRPSPETRQLLEQLRRDQK